MDSASLPSLTPLLDGVDRWKELAPLLPVIVSLELVLSADNAVALAAIAKAQQNKSDQRLSLNIGIGLALLLRIILILMAQWVLRFWPIQLAAGIYLLVLFFGKIKEKFFDDSASDVIENSTQSSQPLFNTIILLAFTDLAFSIDSVAAAVAISDQFLLVVTGASIGVLALRFTSELFIRWLDIYPRLEFAGYIAVGLVGIKLILQLLLSTLDIPEWTTLSIVIGLFVWGFSKKDD